MMDQPKNMPEQMRNRQRQELNPLIQAYQQQMQQRQHPSMQRPSMGGMTGKGGQGALGSGGRPFGPR